MENPGRIYCDKCHDYHGLLYDCQHAKRVRVESLSLKTANKIEKLTPEWLKAKRIQLGLNKSSMAKQLNTAYTTYCQWEAGRRRVPGIVAVAVEYLERKDQMVMGKVQEKINREYKG